MFLELADPRRAFDEAHASGRWSIEFTDEAEASRFAKRLRRLKAIDTSRGEAWVRFLYIRQAGGLVEVVDTDHPDAAKFLPLVKVQTDANDEA